jgi:hypothetical protein
MSRLSCLAVMACRKIVLQDDRNNELRYTVFLAKLWSTVQSRYSLLLGNHMNKYRAVKNVATGSSLERAHSNPQLHIVFRQDSFQYHFSVHIGISKVSRPKCCMHFTFLTILTKYFTHLIFLYVNTLTGEGCKI